MNMNMLSHDIFKARDWFMAHMNKYKQNDEPHGEKWSDEYASPYKIDDFKSELIFQDCPEHLKKYVDTDRMIRDQWDSEKIYIVYTDGDKNCLLEDVGDLFPIWNNKELEFFVTHPNRNEYFTIIEYDQ